MMQINWIGPTYNWLTWFHVEWFESNLQNQKEKSAKIFFRMTDLIGIISSGAPLNEQISSLETQACWWINLWTYFFLRWSKLDPNFSTIKGWVSSENFEGWFGSKRRCRWQRIHRQNWKFSKSNTRP